MQKALHTSALRWTPNHEGVDPILDDLCCTVVPLERIILDRLHFDFIRRLLILLSDT